MGRQYPFTIENGLGEALTFLRIVRGPDGDRVEAEGRAQPGAGPPMHVHKLQEETMQVVSGKLGYQVLGEEPTFAGPGGKRTPEHLRRAYLTTRYRSEYAMLVVPAPVQRIVFPIVVLIGRLLGKYKKYANALAPILRR